MTANISNFGVINFYEHNHSEKQDQAKKTQPVCEDVTPVQEKPRKQSASLPFFVPEKLAELGTYTLEEFEDMYHEKVRQGAPDLAEFLKHYGELQVFNFGKNKKKTIYNKLKAFFGEEMDFGYPNFAAYY